MAGLDVTVSMPRRSAEVNLNQFWAKKLAMEVGVVPCHVLGTFQCVEDSDCTYPVFVCELDDDRVIEVTTSDVRFTDTEGGILK